MKKLKIGDKVRFVGPAIHTISDRVWFEAPKGYVGTVAKANSTGKIYLMIEDCKEACTIHRRQVTHRIVKKKRREFWLARRSVPYDGWAAFEEIPNGIVKLAATEIIKVREVRK